jgi:hypothetical protein
MLGRCLAGEQRAVLILVSVHSGNFPDIAPTRGSNFTGHEVEPRSALETQLLGAAARGGVTVNTTSELPSREAPQSRRRASLIWKSSVGGLLFLSALALAPVWMGVLGWLGYELALAAVGIHG